MRNGAGQTWINLGVNYRGFMVVCYVFFKCFFFCHRILISRHALSIGCIHTSLYANMSSAEDAWERLACMRALRVWFAREPSGHVGGSIQREVRQKPRRMDEYTTHMGVSQNGGTPTNGWFIGKNPI